MLKKILNFYKGILGNFGKLLVFDVVKKCSKNITHQGIFENSLENNEKILYKMRKFCKKIIKKFKRKLFSKSILKRMRKFCKELLRNLNFQSQVGKKFWETVGEILRNSGNIFRKFKKKI